MIKALKRLASKSLVVKEQKEDKDIPKGVCNISGGKGKGDPPVPMPNTEVKPFRADGTWLETARESRSLPDSNYSSIAQPVEQPLRLHTEKRVGVIYKMGEHNLCKPTIFLLSSVGRAHDC